MTQVHHAAWVLPIIGPPIRDGWVAVDGERVVAIGGPSDTPPRRPKNAPSWIAERTAILPGLVNAHAHLELSWMKGRVPPGDSMPAWAARLIELRLTTSAGGTRPIVDAIGEMRASGTALVGDVTNGLATHSLLAVSDLSAAIFHELIGFNPQYSLALMEAAYAQMRELTPVERVRVAIAPHAPYSVSPELFRAIAQASSGRPLSVHLGESPEEIQFLKDGSGPWRGLLERLGAWTPSWTPPNCGPVEYLHTLGVLGRNLIAVHAVQLTDDELRRLAAADATIVTCPRSNRWTGVGDPPVARFYASGARVAIGTDSLASVEDLNLFNEIAVVRRLAPSVPAGRILRSATLDGAQALGFGQDMGWIGPNARAGLIAVRVPAGVADVEEYLVNGTVRPDDISWIR